VDSLPAYHRMNLKCELMRESYLEMFKIEHEMIGGFVFNCTESRQQSYSLCRTVLKNLESGHGTRRLCQILYNIIVLHYPRIRIKNRFVNGILRQAQYSVGNRFLDMQRTVRWGHKGTLIHRIFTFIVPTRARVWDSVVCL